MSATTFAVGGARALLLGAFVALICAGCVATNERDPTGRRFVRNNDVHVVAEVWSDSVTSRTTVHCRVSVQNVSRKTIVVYNDEALPTVLHQPSPATADVFFGLSPEPTGVDFFVPEHFLWKPLASGQRHIYRFQISNPLRERSHYGNYGNPWYEDRRSPSFGQRPDQLAWRFLRIGVGYLVLEDAGVREQLKGVDTLSWGLVLGEEANESTVLERQRHVAVLFSPAELVGS